jgi:exopolysaccharide biosynthesis polyprenyl glycosylphosphotransferase
MVVYPFLTKLSQEEMVSLVKEKFSGKRVCSSVTFYKNITGSFPVFELDPQWLIDHSISLTLSNQVQKRIKRIADILFSLIGILVSLPIMTVVAVLIKLTSKGRVLFVHDRLGLNKKPFKLYKFRTMIEGAERETGPVWARKDDPRVTKLGKVLRKTRLDELPQFFNVLKGDMSFVGPRPIREFFAEKLSKEFPYYYLRFYVKPGLTGWAQVSGSYGETVEGQLRKLEYELFYIHEYSLLLDGVIILKTIQNVLSARGQ